MDIVRPLLREYPNFSPQWESVEPVSLSRALSRLQAERREESAALAKMLSCKDKEVHSLQANVGNLRAATNELQQQVHTSRWPSVAPPSADAHHCPGAGVRSREELP